jgi:pyruvate ferredoxin oxidoreductase delta subunit
MRPITNYEKCTQCTRCWLHCPEGAYNITPDGYYECDYFSCCGCAKCEEACEAGDHLFMIPESAFTDNASTYEMWKKDPDAYQRWFDDKVVLAVPRSCGYHHKGQYAEEIAKKGGS